MPLWQRCHSSGNVVSASVLMLTVDPGFTWLFKIFWHLFCVLNLGYFSILHDTGTGNEHDDIGKT